MTGKPRRSSQAVLAKFSEDFTKRFGEGTIRRRRSYQVVSTGSLTLDYAMGCGGYVVGRITEIWGVESVAKTTLAMIAAGNFQRAFPGRAVAWIDMERTFDYEWAKALGVNPAKLVVLVPENSEDVADMAKMSIKSGLFSLVVLDSVGGMITEEEFEKAADKASVGTAAKIITRMVKIAAVLCDDTDTTMIIVNQTRANISITGGTTTGGGFALKHVTTHKIKLRRTMKEPYTVGTKDDKETLGFELSATVQKNKVAPPGRVGIFALFVQPSEKYGPVGIDRVTEAYTMGTKLGIIQVRGSFYALPGTDQPEHGRDAVLARLRYDPELLERVREQMLEHVADLVADDAPPVDEAALAEAETEQDLDFATGGLSDDFEPDQEVLAKLREGQE
jgi:recombination protein RecA